MLWAAGAVSLMATASAAQVPTSQYRDYTLGDTLAAVAATSGDRHSEPRTVHARPLLLQTFEWRARYGDPSDPAADPVRDMVFFFADDALYRIDVHYDRDRTKGLSGADLVASISNIYGPPVPLGRTDHTLAATTGYGTILSQWRWPDATLTLIEDASAPEFSLVLRSPALEARADRSAREAMRLDDAEAPRRAIEARRKSLEDAKTESNQARARNKPAFRP